jgi:hypothetical protein
VRAELLCHAFTYELDHSEREYMLRAMEARLGAFLPGFDACQQADMQRQLELLRKGGKQ